MTGLGDQIAVLDGLDAMDPTDGRIGQTRARVDEYGRPVMPGVMVRNNVLDASEGANYSGGSSYHPGLPLLPSSVGLAGTWAEEMFPGPGKPYFGKRRGLGNIPPVLPTRRGVIDYSGGANYSGGASWVPGLPLTPSSSGLADALIQGGYGRAGLGAALIQGGYGRAGLGMTATTTDEDLAGAAEAVAAARQMDPADGRVGQVRSRVDEYGRPVMPGVLERSNVLDASEGANYSGGSSYAPGLPLMPSSVGLAGLEELSIYDQLDGADDKVLGIKHAAAAKLRKAAGKQKLRALKNRARSLHKTATTARSPKSRAMAAAKLQAVAGQIRTVRAVRQAVFRRQGGRYAMRRPLWAR